MDYSQIDKLITALTDQSNTVIIKQATDSLETIHFTVEIIKNWMGYMTDPKVSVKRRELASLHLKNIIKKKWKDDDYLTIPNDTRLYFSNNFAHLLLLINRRQGEILCEIAPFAVGMNISETWTNGLPILNQALNKDTDLRTQGWIVLQTYAKICRRYKYSFSSKEVVTELLYFLNNALNPLINFAEFLTSIVSSKCTDVNAVDTLKDPCELLSLIFRIFYALNVIELSDIFEEQLPKVFNIMKFCLDLNEDFQDVSKDLSKLVKLKSKCISLITLFIDKYSCYLEKYLDELMKITFPIYSSPNKTLYSEKMISVLMKHLKVLVSHPKLSLLVLPSISSLLATFFLPCIEFKNEDIEKFCQDWQDFMNDDIQEGDTETKRRNCLDLLRVICRKNADIVAASNKLASDCVDEYLKGNWKRYIDALNICIATKVFHFSERFGVSKLIAPIEDIREIINKLVFPIIEKVLNSGYNNIEDRVMLSSAIKFIYVFRNQICPENYIYVICRLSKFIECPVELIEAYSTLTIERLLDAKDYTTENPLINPVELKNFLPNILASISKSLEMKRNLNILKIFFRVLKIGDVELISRGWDNLWKTQNKLLDLIVKNSTDGNYVTYVFETMAFMIRLYSKEGKYLNICEEKFQNSIIEVIKKNNNDLLPYAFQIFGILLYNSKGDLTNYNYFLDTILSPENWEHDKKYLIPSMAFFFRVYITKFEGRVEAKILERFLNCFNYMLLLREDENAFLLIKHIFLQAKSENLLNYFKTAFVLIIRRIQNDKTSTQMKKTPIVFGKSFLEVIFEIALTKGFEAITDLIDSLGRGTFINTLECEIEKFQYVEDKYSRKVVLEGICKTLLKYLKVFEGKQLISLLEYIILTISHGIQMPENNEEKIKNNSDQINHILIYSNIFDERKQVSFDEKNYLKSVIKNICGMSPESNFMEYLEKSLDARAFKGLGRIMSSN